jgi:three-Cys-motif partner protein
MGFFDTPQGAAVFKHGILGQYLPTWASKVGSTSTGKRVAFIDGYAGAGFYRDGTPASPAIALAAADRLAGLSRDVQCVFVEEDASTSKLLATCVASSPAAARATVVRGRLADHLQAQLGHIGPVPLLTFIDPFGLPLPFSQMIDQLFRRTSWRGGRRIGPATEVLINFVHAGLYRTAGKLEIASLDPVQLANAESTVEDVNASLGGTWWQTIWRSMHSTEQKVERIRQGYIDRILEAAGPGWTCFAVSVSDHWEGKSIYELLLFTQHPHGMWCFNEAVSKGREQLKEFHAVADELVLEPFEPERQWQESIRTNLVRMLRQGRAVALARDIEEVYGTTLGYARGTHVRKAISQVVADGLTSTNPKGGSLDRLVLVPTTTARTA